MDTYTNEDLYDQLGSHDTALVDAAHRELQQRGFSTTELRLLTDSYRRVRTAR